MLERFAEALNPRELRFHCDDRSMEKATWMLQVDALEALRDALELIVEKRHRPAARLFRDIVETMDLAAYFLSGSLKSKSDLEHWYKDEVVPHRVSRDFLGITLGPEAAEVRKCYYRNLSKFTHRTYRALLKSYSLGRDDYLVHDAWSKHNLLVLPETIAAYFAILADLILQFSVILKECGHVSEDAILATLRESLETHTFPRRFVPK